MDVWEKMDYMHELIQKISPDNNIYEQILNLLKESVESEVLYINVYGCICTTDFYCPDLLLENKDGQLYLNNKANQKILGINKTSCNVSKKSLTSTADKIYFLILPVIVSRKRLGTILAFRKGQRYKKSDALLAEYCLNYLVLFLLWNEESLKQSRYQSIENVNASLGILSCLETLAISNILKEINGNEGTVIISKIADKINITRSVIINALRKLESAEVIKTRSLGVKGTHITIINHYLFDEIKKQRYTKESKSNLA